MTVEAKSNQGTSTRPMRKIQKWKEPKKKRLEVKTFETTRQYEPTLVYPPLEEAAQNQLADELKSWALTTKALRIESFALLKGMNPYQFKKLRAKNEYFDVVYQMVESAFACKYSEGGLKKELDAGLVHRHLWMVDPEYYNCTTKLEQKKHELDREKHELAKKVVSGGAASGKIFVEITPLDTNEKATEKPTE